MNVGKMTRVRFSHVAWVIICVAALAALALVACVSAAYADEPERSVDDSSRAGASADLEFVAFDFDAARQMQDCGESDESQQAKNGESEPPKGVLDAVNGAMGSSVEPSISFPSAGGDGVGLLAIASAFAAGLGALIRRKQA